MNNKYMRLFVAQTQLMTAEKMKLDRFCQHGEYLAYKMAIPKQERSTEVDFIFEVELEDIQYKFTNKLISESSFSTFERHLSTYLNTLFKRKLDFESRNEMFKDVMQKMVNALTEEEQKCLATNIDSNTTNVLRALGVTDKTLF